MELGATAGEREPASDVQQPVAKPLGLGLGQLPVEDERLGPDDQVVREHHDLQPHLVELKLLERELGQAVSLSSRIRWIRSSTCACWRWRHSSTATSASGWSVRIAWKRHPSWSVNDACAPGADGNALIDIGPQINQRLLDHQLDACVCAPDATLLEPVVLPSTTPDGLPAPGLRFGEPRTIALLACLCSHQHLFAGLTNKTCARCPPRCAAYSGHARKFRELYLGGVVKRRRSAS